MYFQVTFISEIDPSTGVCEPVCWYHTTVPPVQNRSLMAYQ